MTLEGKLIEEGVDRVTPGQSTYLMGFDIHRVHNNKYNVIWPTLANRRTGQLQSLGFNGLALIHMSRVFVPFLSTIVVLRHVRYRVG